MLIGALVQRTHENTWLQTGLTCFPEFSQSETEIENHDHPINCSILSFFLFFFFAAATGVSVVGGGGS